MGRTEDWQAKATEGQGTRQAPTSMPIMWAVEHEEGREERRDLLQILRSNRQMTKPNIKTLGSSVATVMRNRTGCIWHRE